MHDVFGRRLKLLREQKQLSQLDFANKVGVSKSAISRYEDSKMLPSIKVASNIAKHFNVSLDWLSGMTD